MDQDRLRTHVRVLAWIHIVGELIGLGMGVLLFLFFTGIGAASGDPDAMRILPVFGVFVLAIFTIFSLPGFIAGFGLLRRWSWARYLALVVGFMDLFWVPIGTLVGIYTFWVLMQKGAAEYFERGDDYFDEPDRTPYDAYDAYDAYDVADGDLEADGADEPDHDVVEEVYFRGEDEPDQR